MNNTLTDLQKFTILFGLEFKQLKNRIEYRVQDLDLMLQNAKDIIKEKELNLIARTEGNSAAMRSFFVTTKD